MSVERILKDAGLLGLPFAWGGDGTIEFGDGLTESQIASIHAAVATGLEELVVPTLVTMRQARLALLHNGLLDQVNSAVAALPGADGQAARIEWEFSSTVERHRPLVAALAGALNLSDAQLDALFVQAAEL